MLQNNEATFKFNARYIHSKKKQTNNPESQTHNNNVVHFVYGENERKKKLSRRYT
jgi:hypothetical protein